MATSFTNEEKNDSTFRKEREHKPPAVFGKAKFGKSRFSKIRAGEGQEYTNEDKNDSTFTDESKN